MVYFLVQYKGYKLYRAWYKVEKNSKATRNAASILARRDIEWYKNNFGEDLREMHRLHGLDEERLALETDKRLKAMVTKSMTVTKVIREPHPKDARKKITKYVDVKELRDYEDNATRMKGTELLADVLNARHIKDEEGAPSMIILRVPLFQKPKGAFT